MDKIQYERIATEYLDMVYRIALNHTRRVADADDIVQQTFYKLLLTSRSFEDEEHIRRWLIRVCINECNSFFSGFWRKNVHFFSEQTGVDEIPAAEDPISELQQGRMLSAALQKLTPGCRTVLYLFYYEGYKTREIAQILKMREATVRTRLVRGRKMLKEELKEAWDYEDE